MAKIKITKEEIEKMIIDQLNCKNVIWDKNGNANVELDLEEIKKVELKKEEHIHYHYNPWRTPIYTIEPKKKREVPYWTISTTSSGDYLTYMSTNK